MDNNQRQQNRGPRSGFNRPGGYRSPHNQDQTVSEFFEKVVQVNSVSKKSKGGNKRSLSVLVVVGDKKGKVGVGLGKASDVQSSVRKATAYAKRHLISVPIKDNRTIPHNIFVKLGAAKVLLKSAPEGTGVIAGGAVRVVVEAAGIHDIVSKTLGTSNQASNVYATLKALTKLKGVKEESGVRNLESSKEIAEKKGTKEADEKPGSKKATPKKGEKSPRP